jgi:serine/threonine-protein kinase
MRPERWQQIKALLDSALEREPDQRSTFLAAACGDDESLRNQVESLIISHDQAGAFIEDPAFELMAGSLTGNQGALSIGQSFGHYQIRKLLGMGGMGEVYLAQDTSELGRTVALKILRPELTSDRERMKRSIQEARTVSALNHPNILTIHEVGQAEGMRFIVTEYIDGMTLRERLKSKRLSLRELLDIAIQIAAALDAAHESRVVHRDIKPENIMLRRRDQIVKVLDFGLAKLTENREEREQSEAVSVEAGTKMLVHTAPGLVMGTVAYMSPEQSQGWTQVDHRTDIWSLGVVLYEMVAERVPFEGRDMHRQIIAIQENAPLPLSRYADGVPGRLEEIVEKALAKSADERYQTAKDFLIDLRNLKRRLEVDAEIERSVAPELRTSIARGTVSGPAAGVASTSDVAQGATVSVAYPTSSADYIVREIKQRKRGVVLALTGFFVLSLAAATYYLYFSPGGKAIDSMAVLPFANVSNDPNTEYLSDGISEALINSLTELRQLKVIARSTAFRYKGKEVDPQAVGRELNVRAVLTGRVRQVGDTLDVQVDLVDATTGAQLWGHAYERQVSDVLDVKQAIAREVTEKLRLKLSGEQKQQLTKRDATNAEAYPFYLRGRYYWNKRTAEGLRKAIEQFQQAIDRDPTYALGYVGLADCYLVLEDYTGVPLSENLPQAKAAADRALQIDDSLAEAHTSSAHLYLKLWRWSEAEEEFKRAISLNPNYSTAHHWFSNYFRIKRQFDEAMIESKRGQELDPLSLVLNSNVAYMYLLRNDVDSAIDQCRKNIELDPNFPDEHYILGLAYLRQRRIGEATAECQKAVELSERTSLYLGDLGYFYAVTGRRAEALAILKELEARHARREAIGLNLATVYAGLGDKDQAFAWLEKDFQQRSGLLPRITWNVTFDGLRGDPRYADLVRRMGLQP